MNAPSSTIDRRQMVLAQNPIITRFDPFSAMTVGNGSLAFTADITGLQTFSHQCRQQFPLCTMADWAWHSVPPQSTVRPEDFRHQSYNVAGRTVPYSTDKTNQEPLFNHLRQNPHRLHLGRIGFDLPEPGQLQSIHQTLDLWSATLASRFEMDGNSVIVQTCCHPALDLLAVRVRCSKRMLPIRIDFPYGSHEMDMANWDLPQAHHTLASIENRHGQFERTLDDAKYFVTLGWSSGTLSRISEHSFLLSPQSPEFEFTAHFSPQPMDGQLPDAAQTFAASAAHWPEFWNSGGAVDVSASTDSRAPELQRRIILSQYNTAIHCAGTLPAQETGLLFNSWYGKFHLEMHWWHIVHFAVWNRPALFHRSLGFYQRILPLVRETARRQGYTGARWPKMVGSDGVESPSPIGPLLIWQQPHPIYFAELCYRRDPTPATLEQWREIVFETAQFLACYPVFNDATQRYDLGPPLMTLSENTPPLTSFNPTFELSYWRTGLRLAQQWQERLSLPRNQKWDDVLNHLASPAMGDGVYLMQEKMEDTYTTWNWEHPGLVGAFGMLPGDAIDTGAMRATVRKVIEQWRWDRCWGWDFPMTAMAAARVNEPGLAIDALLMDAPANVYLPNGHNYQAPGLPAYLPSNASLLTAVAMMAAGWTGAPTMPAPGFPRNGKWKVAVEAIEPWL